MTDHEIDALRNAYREDRQRLYTYALSIARSREGAEDAVHGAVQRLLRLERLPAELRPYLFRCVRNAALDAVRQSRVRSESIFRIDPPEAAFPFPPASGADLHSLLDELAPNEREAIVLKIYDDLTFQEIAAALEVPLPTVASWYRRGLEKMRARLNAANEP